MREPPSPAASPLASGEPGDDGALLVESARPLSQSHLWRLQRRYFERAGIDAWRTSVVPHYVTCNPRLAAAYAEVVHGFARDCGAARPLTLVELGGGSGRFAYLFLRAFAALARRSPCPVAPLRYVLTDLAEANLEFWRGHERFRPFLEEGLLEFVRLDVETDAVPASDGPRVVLANYVFDGLPQDMFSFMGGEVHECLASLHAAQPGLDAADPDALPHLQVRYERRPTSFAHYGEPALDGLLRQFARTHDGRTVLFPCATLRCLGRLAAPTAAPTLVLVGDRGASGAGLPEDSGQALLVHGSFSLPVDFRALGEYVAALGGVSLHPPEQHLSLRVSAFLLGEHPTRFAETRFSYQQSLVEHGPDSVFTLRRGIEVQYEQLGLEHLLSLLRLGRYDPKILHDTAPALLAHAPLASPSLAADVVEVVRRTWDNFYSIGEPFDLAFTLGVLLYEFGAPGEALALFQRSLDASGEDAGTRWNMGLCLVATGREEAAVACFRAAHSAEPGFRPPHVLRHSPASARLR